MAEGKRLGEIPDEIPLANSRLTHYRNSDGLMRDAAFNQVPLSVFQTDLQHNDLGGTGAADAHPIGSITDLQSELDSKKPASAPDGHIIEDDGVAMAQRESLNFTGTGLTITDDGPGNTTQIDVAAGVEEAPVNGTAYNRQDASWIPAAQGGHTIQDEGVPVPQQNALNFIGADVTVTDNPGGLRTDVTIAAPPAGEINDGANVGVGSGAIYRGKSGTTLDFKTLRSSDGSVTITNEADTVNVQADFEPTGSVAAHEAASDPHGQYLTEVAAGAAYAPLSHQHALVDITDSGALAALDTVSTAEIDADAVDNTKLADMPANTIKANDVGATGNPKDLTIIEAQAMLDVMEKTTYDPQADGIVEYARALSGIVTNNTGATVFKGTPIYVNEANELTVARQDTSQWAIGVTGEDILNGQAGRGVLIGRVFNIAGFDTQAASIGDQVYLGAAGGLTLTPTEGRLQRIGEVISLSLTGDLLVDNSVNEQTPIESAHANLWYTSSGYAANIVAPLTPVEIAIPQADLVVTAGQNMGASTEPGSVEFDYSASAFPAPTSIKGQFTFGLSGTISAANTTLNVYVGINGSAFTSAELASLGTGATQTTDTVLSAAGSFMTTVLLPGDRLSLFIEADGISTFTVDHFHIGFVTTEVSGGSGAVNHNDLLNRNAADAHSIAAVSGLQAALDGKVEEAPSDGTQYSRQDAGWVSTAGGHLIEDEGVGLPQQSTLNFTGAGVTATDVGGKTVVDIPGGGVAAENLAKFSYYTNNNGTLGGGTHIMTFNLLDYDNNNDTSANGVFTAPRTGEYVFRGCVQIIQNVTIDSTFNLLLRIDGVNDRQLQSYQADSSGEWPRLMGTASVSLTAGQQVVLAVEHDDPGTRNYQGGATRCYFQGEEVPDTVGVGNISNPGIDAHIIADEGVNLAHQNVLNFVGAGVAVTDGAGETVVTIDGGGAGGGHVIEEEGTPLPQRAALNFVGSAVTAADNLGTDATDITISIPTAAASLQKGVFAYQSTGTVLGAGTATKILLDTVLRQDNITWDTVNNRWVCDEASWYTISGTVATSSVPDEGYIYARIYVNGVLLVDGTRSPSGSASPADFSSVVTLSTYLDIGDFVELYAFSSTALTTDALAARTNITIKKDGGGGHVVQDEGTPLTQRMSLDFVGDGVTVTDDSGNDKTVVTITGGGGTGGATSSPIYFEADLNGANTASIPDITNTKITFDNSVVNAGGDFSTDTGRFTASIAGAYAFAFNVETAAGLADGSRIMALLYKNGSEYASNLGVATGAAATVNAHVAAVIHLDAADYVEPYVYHDNGSGLAMSGTVTRTWLKGALIGTVASIPDLAFKANTAVSTQIITNGVWTKIELEVEEFDLGDSFDNVTNYRFTPGVAGYYSVAGTVSVSGIADQKRLTAAIYKNGVLYSQGNTVFVSAPSPSSGRSTVSDLLYLNSTDYLELYAFQEDTAARNIAGGSTNTYFSAYKVQAAAEGGAGEANTGANVGTGAVGLYDGKTGVALDFRTLNSLSGAITIALDAPNQKVDFDLVAANISHTALADIGTNTHAQIDTHISSAGALYTINTVDTSQIADDAVTFAKMQNIATSSFIGRQAAATGDPENLTASEARAVLNVDDGANNYVHPNHTGDVTSAGDGAQTISDNAVSNAKAEDMAAWTIKARNNSALGDPQDITDAVIAEQVTPTAGDFLLGWTGGALRKYDVGNLPTGGAGEANLGANVGAGPGQSFRDKTGVTLNFKTLRSSDASVTITNEADTINLQAAAGAGEANLGDNVGTLGQGVFDGKTGVTLNFRHVHATGAGMSTALDDVNNNITVALDQTAIDHDQLTNFAAAEHIDWALASQGTIHATNYVDNDTTDHTALSNIGTNTHAQIDTHLALVNEHIDWTSGSAGTIDATNLPLPSQRTATGATDTMLNTDDILYLNSASAQTLTIPAGLDQRTRLVVQQGAGSVTLAGSGATLTPAAGYTLVIGAQGRAVSLVPDGANWQVVGFTQAV